MPYYKQIRNIEPKATRHRTLTGLKRLRSQLNEEMPRKTQDSTLILGTWNIRNFDDNRFMNGPRTAEDFQYIAEIISHFDIIAIQEICNDIKPLEILMLLLGGHFDFIITDTTEGKSGNVERLGFIYNKNKVSFKGIAGELVLPENKLIDYNDSKRQFARTPFMCSFQSGWFKFLFSTVHIYFGDTSGPKYNRRIDEIKEVAKFIARRAEAGNQNHILVGDFNIEKPNSPTFNALKENNFEIFQNNEGSNKDQTKFYDQISFLVRENELRLVNSEKCKGVFQFFNSIYREEDYKVYKDDLINAIDIKIKNLEKQLKEKKEKLSKTNSEKKKTELEKLIINMEKSITKLEASLQDDTKLKSFYLKEWRTYHASDHLPLWVELEIDFSDAYLDYIETL